MIRGSRSLGVLVKTFPKISETFILAELLGLERQGFDLTIFALQRPTDAISQPALSRLRAKVVYVGDHQLAPGQRLLRRLRAALLSPVAAASSWFDVARPSNGLVAADVDTALALADALRAAGVPHLHAHFIDRTGAIGQMAARLAGIRCSLSAHAKDIYLTPAAALRRRLRRALFTATCTEYNREALAAVAPRGVSLRRIYHGIDTARFRAHDDARDAGVETPNSPLRLLAVGRLRPKKGFITLLQACALLRDGGVAAQCEIVGYGEQQAELEALIGQLHLGESVTLRGKMSHRELIELYGAADVFVAPCEIAADGDRDGIPNVLLEAMSMRLAVVTTPVSGIPEIVRDDCNGLLVPPADPAALAAALAGLARDPAQRQRLGFEARRSVLEQFGEESNLQSLIGLLDGCVECDVHDHSEVLPESVLHG
jgi:glycosyltransferase involved in cell wall biosynthesis